MKNPKLTPELYTRQMETLLESLHQEIDTKLRVLTEPQDITQLDDYVYQLNSFYYGSFHEKLFPLYRQLMQEDIQSRLNLALQEDTLRQGILGNIKRYAQLYNQVKRLTTTLSHGKETSYQLILANSRYEDRGSIGLYSALKLWREHLQAAGRQLGQLREVLDDRSFCQTIERFPGIWPLVYFWESVDLGQPVQGASYTSVLSYLSYCSRLLRQLQKEDKPFARSTALIKELADKTAGLNSVSMPAAFNRYRSYLTEQMGSALPTLNLYLKLGDTDSYKSVLRRLLQHFDDNIHLLEKAQHFLISGYREALLQACRSPANSSVDISQVQETINGLLDSLIGLEREFSIPGESDFQNFSQRVQAHLEESGIWMSGFAPGAKADQAGSLFASLYHLELERQYLLRSIVLMREDSKRRQELQDTLLQVANNMDSFVNLLGNIRADLERLLAPRNLARLWKDLDVRVERVPLERGKPFPARFLHLLEKHPVNQYPADSEEIVVLHEEGDLFIIRVGDEQEAEVPFMTVSKKE